MKKVYLTLCIFLCVTGLFAQDSIPKFSVFLNIGQSIPLGAYRASSRTSNHLAIAKASSFGKSFQCGFDSYFSKKIGLSLGFSISNFDLDKKSFEKTHTNNLQNADSYLRSHFSGRLYIGLTSCLNFNKVSIEPRFNFGLTQFNFEFSDYYHVNDQGAVYGIISYDYKSSHFISLNSGINVSYEFLEFEGIRLGLQFFSELSYQNPTVEYKETESNKNYKTFKTTEKRIKQRIIFIYYGTGLILKL